MARDENGKRYTVRCDAANAMLLNEFLNDYRKTDAGARHAQEQVAMIVELKKQLAELTSAVPEVRGQQLLERSQPVETKAR